MRLEAAAAGPGVDRSSEVAEVLRLAGPAVAHMALVAITFIGDRAILARQPAALAALHLPSTIAWCLCSLVTVAGIGAVAVVGSRHGARRPRQRAAAVHASLSLARQIGLWAVPCALVLGLASLWFLPEPLRLPAGTYLVIVSAALPLAAIEAAAVGSLQAMGDTKTPLYAALAGSALHLAVTASLASCGWGLEGAALGTVLGFAVAGLGCLRALAPVLDVTALEVAPDEAALTAASAELRRVALPAAGEKMGYHAGHLAHAAIIASLGPIAMAANQTLLAFEAIAYPIAEGCAIAAATLVAQRLGAGSVSSARRGLSTTAWIAVGALSLFGLLALAGALSSATLLSDDAAITEAAARTLPWLALAQPAMAFSLVGTMALRGAGATRSAMLVTFSGTGLRVLLAIALLDRGLEGAWMASAADWLLQSVAVAWLLAKRFRDTPPA